MQHVVFMQHEKDMINVNMIYVSKYEVASQDD